MNFELFQTYAKVFHLDEIRVIGKEIWLDGACVHIVGTGRKEECGSERTVLYLLEEQPEEDRPEQTKREFLMNFAAVTKAMCIREIEIGGERLVLQGGSAGNLSQTEFAKAHLLFRQMIEQGWHIAENSPFYKMDWKRIRLVELQLEDPVEVQLAGSVRKLTVGPTSRDYIVRVPVRLERGGSAKLSVPLEKGGEEVVCYINQVTLLEPLVKEREKFKDPQYRERILQHVSEEEYETMKDTALDTIARMCPEGMGYFTVEYECTRDNFSAQFNAAEELDLASPSAGTTVIGGSFGATSIILLGSSPAQETGPHGLRSRCATIQYAVPAATEALDAELFMMTEMIPEKEYYFDAGK